MKWTFEKLQKEADKCLTRGYTAANKHNLMDEIFKNHMKLIDDYIQKKLNFS